MSSVPYRPDNDPTIMRHSKVLGNNSHLVPFRIEMFKVLDVRIT